MPLRPALKHLSLTLIAIYPAHFAHAAGCHDQVVCMQRVRLPDGGVSIVATNTQSSEIIVTLTGELDNGTADAALPRTVRVPGMANARLVDLRQDDTNKAWSYQYSLRWQWGDSAVEHDNQYVYRLPFPSGRTYRVSQGYDGKFSHGGKHAVDFPMPPGSPVLAARRGTVIAIQDGFKRGGGKKFRKKTNYILVQHDDRTIGSYCHITYQGARAKVGQKVEAGDLIALSGNTGFSRGPHLHFHVATPRTEKVVRTFPVQFYEASLGVVLPTQGAELTAP